MTADLGVAMRRVRAKQIAKIKQLCTSLFQTSSGNGNDKNVVADGDALERDERSASSQKCDANDSEKKGPRACSMRGKASPSLKLRNRRREDSLDQS